MDNSPLLEEGGDVGEPECRICAEPGKPSNPLIKPCACTGSMASIHVDCLRRWIEARPERHSCEICHSPYRIRVEQRLVFDCNHMLCNPTSCQHCTDALILVLGLVCMIYMMALIMPTIREHRGQSQSETGMQVALTVASVLLLIFALFTLAKLFKRWRIASSEPHIV